MAEIGNEVGDEILLAVGVNQGKHSTRDDHIRQTIFSAIGEILHDVSQKFQLLNEMRVFRRVDLGELHLQEGEFLVHAPQDFRRDLRGAVVNKLYNLGHGASLTVPE